MEYHINCAGIDSAQEFHWVLARDLRFPKWYGHNLDALHDVLTTLPEDTRLVLKNWDPNQPWATRFRRVFEDCARENPEFTCIFS